MRALKGLALVLLFAVASSAAAQLYPLPYKQGSPQAICTGCLGVNSAGEPNDGKPTVAYGGIIANFTGRLVDSNTTAQVQSGFRTARAKMIRVADQSRGIAPPRVYAGVGESIFAYSTSTFFSQSLPAGTAAVSALNSVVGTTGGRTPLERILVPDALVYPDGKNAGWNLEFVDQQERLFDFDFDDRGYVYGAFDVYGWGIVKDDGRTSGGQLEKVSQVWSGGDPAKNTVADSWGVAPRKIVVVSASGRYYAVVAAADEIRGSARWDVTDPAAPKFLGKSTQSIVAWARDDAAKRVAVASGRKISIYTYEAFGSGLAALLTDTSGSERYADAAFDEAGNLWAVEGSGQLATNRVALFKKNPNGGYDKSTFSPFGQAVVPVAIAAKAGYVAVIAATQSGNDLFLFDASGGSLSAIDTANYFKKYYHRAPAGFAQPGIYANVQQDVEIVKSGTKTYLMYNSYGLGDVYELGAAGPSISVAVKGATFGTPNPYSQGAGTGPYPGDPIRFQATASTGSFGLDWNFGNVDAGAENTRSGTTGVEIVHQFSGLNTAAKVTATKTVTATASSNPGIADSTQVSLSVPTARIALASTNQLLTGGGFKVVAGDQFTDASDGSIESHYASWLVGGSVTKARPDTEVSVGTLGTRSVSLSSYYGKYDANFNSTAPYQASVAAMSYDVLPFLARLKPLSRSGSNVTFDADAQFTTIQTLFSASMWTVEWSLTSSTGTLLEVSNPNQIPVAVNADIPAWTIDRAKLANNSVLKLKVTVPSGQVAQGYEVFEVEQTLKVPDPDVVFSNCDNVGSPCQLTATSLSGASTAGWQLSWSIQTPAGTVTKTGNPVTLSLTSAGNYTVNVTETVYDITRTESRTVAAALCGPPPTASQVSINWSCPGGSCDPGETVSFWPTLFMYTQQDCDQFVWNFGDGQTATGFDATNQYSTAKTYTVKLTVKNSNDPVGTTVQTSLTVGSAPPPPPPPAQCSAPTVIDFSFSGAKGCGPGKACEVGEQITFSGTKSGAALGNCDIATWTFGAGGSTSTSKAPRFTFQAVGTHDVTLAVSNSSGNGSKTKSLTIVAPTSGGGGTGGTCSTTPSVANVLFEYSGATSGCGTGKSIQCARNESITFEAKGFGYTFGSCDTISWNFGDGTNPVEHNGATTVVTHPFGGTAAIFNVQMTVTNSRGTATISGNVAVAGGAPIKEVPAITLTAFPTTGAKGVPITFTATSSMETTTGWTWNFGDATPVNISQAGLTSKTSTISHVFDDTGSFNVSVSARNSTDIVTAPTGQASNRITISNTPEYRYLLPAVAHANGQNGSVWRTDVLVYNSDPNPSAANPLVLTASFNGATQNLGVTTSTHIYEDFMYQLVKGDGIGPVIVSTRSAYAPRIWTRTYSKQPDGGTFGQFIPAVRIDASGGAQSNVEVDAAVADPTYHLAGLRAEADYRTNVGFVNPTAEAFDATIRVYDGTIKINEFKKTLQPFVWNQFQMGTELLPGLTANAPFRLEIRYPSGKWAVAYASIIDARTSDPVYIEATSENQVLSEDLNQILVPGVGRTGQWRSDVTIFNPDADAVQLELSFVDQTGAELGKSTLTLDSRRFLSYTDVMSQGLFGDVTEKYGSLKIKVLSTNEKHPIAFARTYFDKGPLGTYGQGIPSFAMARANVKPGKPAIVPAIRDEKDLSGQEVYRTNLGLMNLSNVEVEVTVSALDPTTGQVAMAIPFTLAANSSRITRYPLAQWTEAGAKLTRATLRVEVTKGTGDVWAFASVIDGRTQDPEYVPATPLVP